MIIDAPDLSMQAKQGDAVSEALSANDNEGPCRRQQMVHNLSTSTAPAASCIVGIGFTLGHTTFAAHLL